MDMREIEAHLNSPNPAETDPGVYVCEASLVDWKRYVKSEQQALVSRAMAWNDGQIYIVELPGRIHDTFSRFLAIAMFVATGRQHLAPCGSSYVNNLEHIEPDCSFGPTPGFGATLINGLAWLEYRTLKVEVGVSSRWQKLDHRAVQWSQFPGVEYILLVRLSPGLQVREYKLLSVVGDAIELPIMLETPIINPTNVVIDSRRLLGRQAHVPIPANFTSPNLTIDLFLLVQDIIACVNA
ncbi:hypothetical protein THRCLA_05304 [Thraustotheca clavata]|uniref:Restriction endonuclease domain-containing protein n=1 Tax=Thraustotheca clavata TaxID=74557 RepID=A0A1V9ZWZ2_9STRA|nr:hypothetical protein THRCLA_05304 [Thraustotheca clavata]